MRPTARVEDEKVIVAADDDRRLGRQCQLQKLLLSFASRQSVTAVVGFKSCRMEDERFQHLAS